MLTHCPECQQELSTAATQCPHCGAPVKQGQLAGGGAPVAKPVAPGYAQPAPPMGAPPPPPPQSHCLRNCFIAGCLLIVVGVVVFVASTYYVANRVVKRTPADITALGEEIAPGATTPPHYTPLFGLNWDFTQPHAKGVFLTSGDPKKVDPATDTIVAFGGLTVKQDKKQLSKSFEEALSKINQGGPNAQQQNPQILKEEEVELSVGGTPTKALHLVRSEARGNRDTYVLVLEPWDNEYGWLAVVGDGPEGKFDLDGFKAFLASLKKK